MKNKGTFCFLVLAIIISTLLVSCASTTPTTTPAPPSGATVTPAPSPAGPGTAATITPTAPTATSAAQPEKAITKTLKIGWVGYLGAGGLDTLHGNEVMVDMVNARGGLDIGGDQYELEIISYDNQNSQSMTMSAVNRLIYVDNVKFIIADGSFVETYLPITEANKVIVDSGTPSQATLMPNLKYTFYTGCLNAKIPLTIAWYCKNNPEKVETVVSALADTQWGHATEGFMYPAFQAFGVNPISVYYPAGSTDLSAMATKVLSLEPTTAQAMGNFGSIPDILALKAIYQAGYRGQFFSPVQISATTLLQYLPPEMLESFILNATACDFDPPATQLGRDFKAGWIAKYGQWEYPGVNVEEFNGLIAALQQADSLDPDKVMATVSSGMRFEVVDGSAQMISRPDLGNNRSIDSISTILIKQFKDGQPALLKTVSLDEAFELLDLLHR